MMVVLILVLGTDLNRNQLPWDGRSSDYHAWRIYHGPSAESEPEVDAIRITYDPV
jgi:hypothetical protein